LIYRVHWQIQIHWICQQFSLLRFHLLSQVHILLLRFTRDLPHLLLPIPSLHHHFLLNPLYYLSQFPWMCLKQSLNRLS
jgi:hypothetical protein